MIVGITGATGFLGRYILAHFAARRHKLKAWYRLEHKHKCFDVGAPVEWLPGELGDPKTFGPLVEGCELVIHSALYHPAGGWSAGDDLLGFLQKNFMGTIGLIEAARRAAVRKFIFISSCAVHELVLQDRRLDETHPLYPKSHYGAHKAAIEAFVHSYALGRNFDICALRPAGIYGVACPVENSKWYSLVRSIVRGETVNCQRGGKEVHAQDVARAIELLAASSETRGQVYNCDERYISDWEVARIAKQLSGSRSDIQGTKPSPRNVIDTSKLRALGMTFGGDELLNKTIQELVRHARSQATSA